MPSKDCAQTVHEEQQDLKAYGRTMWCRNFNHENVAEGKAAAKAELRKRMDLSSADVPLVSVVTRLTHQKGIHLIKHAAWRTLERGGQFVLLGSAPDARVQVRKPDVEHWHAFPYSEDLYHSRMACGNASFVMAPPPLTHFCQVSLHLRPATIMPRDLIVMITTATLTLIHRPRVTVIGAIALICSGHRIYHHEHC